MAIVQAVIIDGAWTIGDEDNPVSADALVTVKDGMVMFESQSGDDVGLTFDRDEWNAITTLVANYFREQDRIPTMGGRE